MKLTINPYHNFLEIKSQIYLNKLKKCEQLQNKLFNQIIKTNKKSMYGKINNFKKIKNIEDFQNIIPIVDYEQLKKFIDAEKNKNHSKTIINEIIEYFAITSGTTNTPKFLPHTKEYIKKRQISWEVWNHSIYNERPKSYSLLGSILTFTSKSFDGFTKSHIKYGSVSGKIHDLQPIFAKKLFAVPDKVAQVDNFKSKYYLKALFSIRKNLTLIATPNPSTMLIYSKTIIKNIDQIIKDLENNTIEIFQSDNSIPFELKNELQNEFKKDKKLNFKTAQRLKKLKQKNQIKPKYIFPNLQTIGCWTRGHVNIYLKELVKQFGEKVMIRELGYMASEGRFSIPIQTKSNGEGILDIDTNFYEFIKVEEYETKNPKIYLAHQVQPGQKYYIIITNENGLYRYDLNDIIQVTGFFENSKTPMITFIQKGKYFSSITGEKVSEWEINHCIKKLQKTNSDIHIKTFFVLPNLNPKNPNYNYYIEFDKTPTKKQIKKYETILETELQIENIEYKEKRESKRLKSIKIHILPKHSIEKIKLEFSKNKSNDSQVKEPKLIVLEKDIVTVNKFLDKYKIVK